ncbi:MAG: cation:proton antiporter [Actinomycetota bacterium]
MIAAAAESEITAILVDLFVLFLAAKLLGDLFVAMRQPGVVGELLAGVLVGPHLLGLVGPEGHAVLDVIAELGVIILLFTVGLETSARELRRVGRSALSVGVLGVILPLGAGITLMLALGYEHTEALFVAAALMATSVGVTARVLRDLRALQSPTARIVLGAAVVDDILAIMVLSVVAGLAVGQLTAGGLVISLLEVIGFLVIVVLAGPRVIRRLSDFAHTPLIPRSPFVFAVLLTLGLAALSGVIGLASLIGAFLAGMIFEFSRDEVARDIEPVYQFLVPFFFAITGTRLDPSVFMDPSILGLAAVVTVIAIVTKVAGGYLGSMSQGRHVAIAVGVGMVPRGEVGLIVASLGLGLGVISTPLFGTVVAMTVVTTLLTPPVLGPLIRRMPKARPTKNGERAGAAGGEEAGPERE